jgi:hypothetical protein
MRGLLQNLWNLAQDSLTNQPCLMWRRRGHDLFCPKSPAREQLSVGNGNIPPCVVGATVLHPYDVRHLLWLQKVSHTALKKTGAPCLKIYLLFNQTKRPKLQSSAQLFGWCYHHQAMCVAFTRSWERTHQVPQLGGWNARQECGRFELQLPWKRSSSCSNNPGSLAPAGDVGCHLAQEERAGDHPLWVCQVVDGQEHWVVICCRNQWAYHHTSGVTSRCAIHFKCLDCERGRRGGCLAVWAFQLLLTSQL